MEMEKEPIIYAGVGVDGDTREKFSDQLAKGGAERDLSPTSRPQSGSEPERQQPRKEPMKTIEYRDVVDRTGWPTGPWDGELDKVQFQDPYTGYPCLAVRGPVGAWCGYVGIPPTHPLYERNYDFIHEHADIRVHGGLTFTGHCDKGASPERGICHVPEAGEAEPWWVGFDTAHAGDRCPGMEATMASLKVPWGKWHEPDVYRDLSYVVGQIKDLSGQLKTAESITGLPPLPTHCDKCGMELNRDRECPKRREHSMAAIREAIPELQAETARLLAEKETE